MDEDVVISVKGMSKSFRILDPSQQQNGKFKKKVYEDFVVFDNVDLEVRKGEVVGILGRNGCGKSTFMKIVSGIIEPDKGTVEVKGKVASILELSMGFHPDLTGRENIFLRSELYGIPRETVKEHIEEIVEYSDLGVFIDNPVRTYSSGMRSRLAFSVMVNVDAEIFMVDEALSTGDMAFASKASEHLKNLVRSGKTVLFTSHSLNTIKNTCTRAVWINDHHIVMDGPAEDVCDAYSRSVNESFEETRHLAEGGSSSAQYRLATFCRDGIGTERDMDKCRFWLEAASSREHPMAMVDLADLIAEEDRERANELYRMSADLGNNEARRKYAMSLASESEAIESLRGLLEDLAKSGYPYDLYNYGDFLYSTATGAGQKAEAFRYVSEASEKGWNDADLLLAKMYREGAGTPKDMDRSTQILEKSAEKGNVKAMLQLADQFYMGKFVPKDHERAYKWYLRAALAGNLKSQYQVAMMLSQGDGVEKDEEAAHEWYSRYASCLVNDVRLRAVDVSKKRTYGDARTDIMIKESSRNYHTRSMMTLAFKYMEGKGFKKNPKAGFDLMQKAALAQGSPRTQLAEMYLEGKAVEKDEQKALQLLRDASAAGDAKAMYLLALMYRDGNVVEKDTDLYRQYMSMAYERGDRDAAATVKKWRERKKH